MTFPGHPTRSWSSSEAGVQSRSPWDILKSGGVEHSPCQPAYLQADREENLMTRKSEEESQLLRLLDEWDVVEIGNYYEFFAAGLGNLEWLRFCLNRKHDGILKDDKGFTAIHFAAQNGKLASLQVLIEEYQFPVDLPTNNGQTPLHLVIQGDKANTLPCILYLLKKGAALTAETCNGSTPLHLAAREGLLSCVKVLVQNGANVYAQDAMGCKPIDYCIIWNNRDCARFLKHAMWKQDKKHFAHEMRKLKKLKDELALVEHNYLTECQEEHQILRESELKKWLQRKRLQHHAERQLHALPQVVPHSKAPRHQGLSLPKLVLLSPEARLRQILQPKPQPLEKPISLRPQSTVTRPMVWNFSNNPARFPTAQIRYPQGIRLGVHPDPSLERDLSSFLEVRSDEQGGPTLYTVAGDQVAPLPQLPFEVIVHTLCPSVQPERMKVPQGFCSVSVMDVPQKRHWDNAFRTDTLAMNLRETFDEAFLAAVGTCQGFPTLPSPKTPP
ncbi:PREDICTED: ankyrin repeat domain-containing protein 53 [Condylura cristata]|uniref:ankyrin repeat domain-containing protein 53 n=1 Tax=Condylura cristata TaxID=143302 RepID=UPI0003346D31|nr:PREDICTED: ankyrin repeat domain-containing protein 53 [Condylura cristata]